MKNLLKRKIFLQITLILIGIIFIIDIKNICVDTLSKYITQKEYEKKYNNNYIINETNYDFIYDSDIHKFDFGSYLQEDAKFVHFEEWRTNELGPTTDYIEEHPDYVGPPTIIIYKNPNGTYFAIEYCRYIPNKVTIYENFTKDNIRTEKIITKKESCGHYHSNFEGVDSSDGKVWYIDNVKEITIEY